MPNQEHLKLLMQGRDTWNAWRKANPDTVPFLRSAQLVGCNLSDYDLSNAYLKQAHLGGATLDGCKLREANLSEAHMDGASLVKAEMAFVNLCVTRMQHANLCGANLRNAILVGTDLRDATLNEAHVYGISAWDVKLDGAKQDALVVTRPGQAKVTTNDLEVAQFIYLLLNHKKLRNVITTITSKAVLILGRFTPERKDVLDTMASELRRHNLLPIIFDFERSKARDFTETIKILAAMSLFVIVDLTNPKSSPLELQATVPDYQIPKERAKGSHLD